MLEQWGSGISRIINACKDQGLPSPKIEEKNDFFDVELIRPRTITDDYERLADDKPSENVGYRRIVMNKKERFWNFYLKMTPLNLNRLMWK